MTAQRTAPRKLGALAGALLVMAAMAALAVPAAALADPQVEVAMTHQPTSGIAAGGTAQFEVAVSNAGPTNSIGDPMTVDFALPTGSGLHIVDVTDQGVAKAGVALYNCTIAVDQESASCDGPDFAGIGLSPIGPGEEPCDADLGEHCRILVTVAADPGLAPGQVIAPTVHVDGAAAGAGTADASDPTDTWNYFDIVDFEAANLNSLSAPYTNAGGRPYESSTSFDLTSTFTFTQTNGYTPNATEQVKDVQVHLPPGFVANPSAYPKCSEAQLATLGCPTDSQVGTVDIHGPGGGLIPDLALNNMVAPPGSPGQLGFSIEGITWVHLFARVRSGGDYGLDVTAPDASQVVPISGADVSVWGVPADSSHDALRQCQPSHAFGCANSQAADPNAFLALPTSCTGAQPVQVAINSWQSPGTFLEESLDLPATDGCNALDYASPSTAPTLQARPTTNVGDAPSGLDVDMHIPQNDDPNGTAEAHLRDATVTLPEGLVVNPGGANGLDGCSLAEFGYTSTDPDGTIHTTPNAANCPDASRQASVEVVSPLLDHPIKGSVYIADPFANPFRSLIALYIAVDDPQTGIVVKLAGQVHLNPNTGRITATFDRNPQLPFENFKLNFFGGAGGALRTPSICGNHTTTSTLTPWSAPDAAPADVSDTWQITQNCVGSEGEMPNAPTFDAGAVSPIAGAHSPFVVHLRREDGSQNFSAVTVSPPQGLVAKLAGTPACSDGDLAAAASKTGQAESANPSCPLASQIGQVSAGAGAGPAPYYAHGKVYLAGPYKGAPLSLATIIPATAGPFDLGTVVTRIAAHVNPRTAEITAESDPIPSILQGIPLDVKTVDVALDKPDFTLNPTSCDVMAVGGLLTSTLNQVASLSSRFQLGECTGLGFKPHMTLRLRGGTKRGKHPALTIALMPRPGDANIASVSVALPRSEFLENAHIRTVCTRPDFAADACPAGAIYGESTVDTPLLDYDLAGHVYLRSSDNLLPDVVPDLRGPAYQPIKLETAGRADSIRGGIRTTIDFVPDAPFTKATVALQGGAKGLLVNSRNICDRVYRATVKYTAHNGKTFTAHPALRAKCGRKAKRGKRRAHRRR